MELLKRYMLNTAKNYKFLEERPQTWSDSARQNFIERQSSHAWRQSYAKKNAKEQQSEKKARKAKKDIWWYA